MTTLTHSKVPTFRSRLGARLAMTRDLLVIGLCLTLIAGFLFDIAAGARPVQPAAVQGALLITSTRQQGQSCPTGRRGS
jgi:hypothetical protein